MFRFKIRDVLWLVVVIGISVAWYVEHNRLTTRVTQAEQLADDGLLALDRTAKWVMQSMASTRRGMVPADLEPEIEKARSRNPGR
jgi:hypothetical protein